ncbi:hypothetical protein ACYJW8_05050 [Frateuria aurantia]
MSDAERLAITDVAIDDIWKGVLAVIDQHQPSIKAHLFTWMTREIGLIGATLDLGQRLRRELPGIPLETLLDAKAASVDMETLQLKSRLLKHFRQALRED